MIYRFERALLPPVVMRSWPWWLLKVAWTDLAVCYMSTAFIILDGRKSLEIYAGAFWGEKKHSLRADPVICE